VPDPKSLESAPRRRLGARHVLIAVVVALLAWFALANLDEVSVRFLFAEHRAPLIVVIAVSTAWGGALMALVSWRRGRGRARRAPD
jgi:uncharacterized integral membrane protein